MPCQFHRSIRGSSVLIRSVLLIGLVVVVAAAVDAAAFDTADASPTPTRPTALSLGVSGDILSLTHEGGAPLDVDSLAARISVDDESLARQPPVPFFSASGFRPGPAGPFNAAADPRWIVGKTATLKLAGTNDPTIEPGATVTVRVFGGDTPVAALETTAPWVGRDDALTTTNTSGRVDRGGQRLFLGCARDSDNSPRAP